MGEIVDKTGQLRAVWNREIIREGEWTIQKGSKYERETN